MEPRSVCDSCHQSAPAVRTDHSGSASQQPSYVTNLLLTLNLLVFVAMLFSHVPLMNPGTEQIIRWGGNFGPLTLGGQPWRVLTNLFVHIGILHLAANMWALLVLGQLAESLYGRAGFLAIYLITGVAGSLGSLSWNPLGVSAGASGALFGIAGALIITLYAGKLQLPKNVVRLTLWTLLLWAAFDLGYGLWKSGVDNAAHIGGLVAGLILGYPMGRHLSDEGPSRRARLRVLLVAFIAIIVGFIAVWRLEGYIVDVEHARMMIVKNKPDQALALLQAALQRHPNEALVHVLVAEALERKEDFMGSEREFKQAINLAPKNGTIWKNLGNLYVHAQRWTDAADAYTHSATLGKDNGLSWYNAGVSYLHADQPQAAAEALRKCLAVNPYSGEAWYQLGISMLNLKQNNDAVRAFQQAARLLPNSPDAHLALGNALLSLGEEEAAKAEMLKAYQLREVQQRAIQQLQKQQRRQSLQSPASPH